MIASSEADIALTSLVQLISATLIQGDHRLTCPPKHLSFACKTIILFTKLPPLHKVRLGELERSTLEIIMTHELKINEHY